MEFKEKIKARRLELNMTLDELSSKIGVTSATISRWESGEIKNVRRDKIKLLSDALNVSPAYLMDWTDEIEKPVSNEEDGQIKDLIDVFNSLTSEHQSQAVDYLHFLSAQEQKK